MIRWAIDDVVLASTTEPVTLAEAKSHCRVVLPDEDEWLTKRIVAARRHIERKTNRQLMPATVTARTDGFRCVTWLDLPKPPLRTVTSISYVDTAGDTQTWSSALYRVSAPTGPTARRGRVQPIEGETWPIAQCVTDAVTVVFTAGYASAEAVPEELKFAMLLLIGFWWVQREAVLTGSISKEIEFGVESLTANYKSRAEQ